MHKYLAAPRDEDRFVPRPDDDEGTLWEVEEIIAEKKGRFLIKWKGVDGNGQAWPESWCKREDITDDVVQEWRLKRKHRAMGGSETNGERIIIHDTESHFLISSAEPSKSSIVPKARL